MENGGGEEKQSGPDVTPLRLTPEEWLRLENYYLKAENLRLQGERLRQDFVTSSKMLKDLQKESLAFQAELDAKYGVKVASFRIGPDGTLLAPMATAPGGPAGAFGTIGNGSSVHV